MKVSGEDCHYITHGTTCTTHSRVRAHCVRCSGLLLHVSSLQLTCTWLYIYLTLIFNVQHES